VGSCLCFRTDRILTLRRATRVTAWCIESETMTSCALVCSVDMEVAVQASTFIGNPMSSLSHNVVQMRLHRVGLESIMLLATSENIYKKYIEVHE